MMRDAPPQQPDSKRLFDRLFGLSMEPGSACALTQEVGDMAAANLIARFESKPDAQESRLEAQNTNTDAQTAQFASLRWMVGLGSTPLALLMTLLRFLG